MKANIKDDQSGPKQDSEKKLATITKSEKASDFKISEAKKIVISQAITEATNQTPAGTSSASNENLFSQFTNPEKAFTPLSSIFSSVAFSKDRVLLVNTPKFGQPFVFGQQTFVPGSLQNKQEPLTTAKPSVHINSLVLPPKINAPQTSTSVSMKENTDLNNSISNPQSSTVRLSMHNSLVVPDIMNSVQTIAGAQAMPTTFNDSLINLNSLSPERPLSKLQSSTPVKASTSTQNSLSQTIDGKQPMKDKIVILKDSILINSLVFPPKINAPQTATSVSIKENTDLNDSLINLNSLSPERPLSKLQSSTPAKASTQNSLSQTIDGKQPMKDKIVILNESIHINSLAFPPKINAPQTATSVSMKKNSSLNDSISNQQSSTTVRLSMHNSSMVPDKMNSVQTIADAQAITTTFNDSLINLKSSTPEKPLSKLQSSTPVTASTQNSLSQTIVGAQPTKYKTVILNDSSSNKLSSSTVQPSMQNGLVSNTINLPQLLSDVQPMEVNGMFDDLLQVQKSLNTITPSMQNNSCGNGVHSEQCVLAKKLVVENTEQVAMPPVQPSVENVNSGKSLHDQRLSVPVPVNNSHSNLQKACELLKKLQYSLQQSISTQTPVSNTTLSVSKDKNVLPSQNSSTKHFNKLVSQNSSTTGVKRKAEETKNVLKNAGSLENSVNSGNLGNSGKKKKNKRKQKFVQPQIVKKNHYNYQNNSPEMKNSNALTCAIVEEQYPNMPPLTNVHLGIIRNVIKEKIDNIPDGVFVPKFVNAFIKDGVILVECANSNSKDWLKHTISNYNPQKGVYLKVIPPDAINEYYTASIFVHDEENAIDVLRRLQKQNSDVSIQNWLYQSTIIVKEGTPGITINVGIPATSVAQLKKKNFKLFHAMEQVMVVMQVVIPF